MRAIVIDPPRESGKLKLPTVLGGYPIHTNSPSRREENASSSLLAGYVR